MAGVTQWLRTIYCVYTMYVYVYLQESSLRHSNIARC